MKRILLLLSLSLALPAHAGWLEATKSFCGWLVKTREAKPYTLAAIVSGTAAMALYGMSLRQSGAKQKQINEQDLKTVRLLVTLVEQNGIIGPNFLESLQNSPAMDQVLPLVESYSKARRAYHEKKYDSNNKPEKDAFDQAKSKLTYQEIIKKIETSMNKAADNKAHKKFSSASKLFAGLSACTLAAAALKFTALGFFKMWRSS